MCECTHKRKESKGFSSGYSLMNFTFFGCLVRGFPLPLGFLKGALPLLSPASKIENR